MPGICQSPGRSRVIFHVVAHFELCFVHSNSYSFAQSASFSFITFIFLKHGPPSEGGKSLLCDPGSELRLEGREKIRVKTLNGMRINIYQEPVLRYDLTGEKKEG